MQNLSQIEYHQLGARPPQASDLDQQQDREGARWHWKMQLVAVTMTGLSGCATLAISVDEESLLVCSLPALSAT